MHIQTVNSRHSQRKGFLRRFRGIVTKYLDSCPRWFHLVALGRHPSPRACLAAASPRTCLRVASAAAATANAIRQVPDGCPWKTSVYAGLPGRAFLQPPEFSAHACRFAAPRSLGDPNRQEMVLDAGSVNLNAMRTTNGAQQTSEVFGHSPDQFDLLQGRLAPDLISKQQSRARRILPMSMDDCLSQFV